MAINSNISILINIILLAVVIAIVIIISIITRSHWGSCLAGAAACCANLG